ncbi:HutD family protein [Acidiphilium sp. AL]|uniref:HutD family protein n=1 Tax=Acidiphilium iwatense TaxID=768198 RepID=A0ABS9E5F4_9PROT|nr:MULTISPECIES: HutD family protein [Acidiphilium]MCF3948852.1 HutD family protein [Acidiphilium iwatense]MCU4162152.1 HutD family protein [Acidiphilium sp. AL]
MRIIRSGEYRCMPWKNGGGETAEIDIFPPESGIDAFDWRVSMAHVTADGAFSQFTGIDRTLSILEGKGIRLAVSDQAGIDITPDSLPYSFPADVPTVAQLIDGPVIDLNVMTRRGRFVHRVTRLRQTAPVVWRLKSDLNPDIGAWGSSANRQRKQRDVACCR